MTCIPMIMLTNGYFIWTKSSMIKEPLAPLFCEIWNKRHIIINKACINFCLFDGTQPTLKYTKINLNYTINCKQQYKTKKLLMLIHSVTWADTRNCVVCYSQGFALLYCRYNYRMLNAQKVVIHLLWNIALQHQCVLLLRHDIPLRWVTL